MRLGTLKDGTRDGWLVVVLPDGAWFAMAPVHTLQEAVEQWDKVAPQLAAFADVAEPRDPAQLAAPLPRAWQWLDGSAFARVNFGSGGGT